MAPPPHSTAREKRLHSIWARVATVLPFVLPEALCDHPADQWRAYDADLAGCAMCGAQHVCREGGDCAVVENDEGHQICTTTGCCVRSVSYHDHEYIEHVRSVPARRLAACRLGNSAGVSVRINKKNRYRCWVFSKLAAEQQQPPRAAATSVGRAGGSSRSVAPAPLHPPSLQLNDVGDAASQTYYQILEHVRYILCSSKWEESIELERQKVQEKTRQCVVRCYKNYKMRHPGLLPIVPDIIGEVCRQMARVREVRHVPVETRDRVAEYCADAIFKHTILLDKMCRGVITDNKLRNSTVGLLYLLKSGITIHQVVVLPKCPELRNLLPQENHLQSIFGVKGKVVVEMENISKLVLRKMSRADLEEIAGKTW